MNDPKGTGKEPFLEKKSWNGVGAIAGVLSALFAFVTIFQECKVTIIPDPFPIVKPLPDREVYSFVTNQTIPVLERPGIPVEMNNVIKRLAEKTRFQCEVLSDYQEWCLYTSDSERKGYIHFKTDKITRLAKQK